MPERKRIERTFARLREEESRPALVAFITAGDPDYQTSLDLACALPGAGADVIELGMPFTDPMADGPAIQRSSQRALKGGQTMVKTLELVRSFRAKGHETPIVLMGYYNPVYSYGNDRFLADAVEAGVDALIIVDVPPELDRELCLPAIGAGLNFIRLATPTTDEKRLPAVLANTSGFVYYVSIAGITGTRAPDLEKVRQNVLRIKAHTDLPVCVGFGVKSTEQVEAIGAYADGVVVGSALVNAIEENLDETGKATARTLDSVTSLVSELAAGLAKRPFAAQHHATGQAAPA